jgi:hypothetical protein
MTEYQGAPPSTDALITAPPSTTDGHRERADFYGSRASTILILGIAGLVVFPPAGIAAWIMGSRLKKEANAAGFREPDRSRAGRICGVVGTILTVMMIVGMLLYWTNRNGSSHMTG